ncbi:LacI family DNA-binding transcriptional regulator [Sphingomonas rosea]|uniref:LacI family DNA-binding transcriptional regulator n=1 Tax=Sphingomonas rosea TaxID=335605 RepID=A0ABP7UFL9_9SPHN
MSPTRTSDQPPVRTLSDLAKIAGVSAGTVSRALAGNSLVNDATRDRIVALARAHGFRPNQMASSLRRQKTDVIGIVIPLGHDQRQQISDAFFMTLLGHLADALTERGYDLMLRRVLPDRDEDWLDRFIGSGMIDGVIVIGQSDQLERIEEAAANFRPMVVWGDHAQGQQHCVVGTDNRLGGKLAAERLIAGGARHIYFLGDVSAVEFAARFAGATDAAEGHGVAITPLTNHLSADRLEAEVAGNLDRPLGPGDAIFAASDMLAVAALARLRTRGIDVPGTVKVIGFDDLPFAAQTSPPLTTIRQDIRAGAFAMVDRLMRRLDGADAPSIVLPPTLVERGTA